MQLISDNHWQDRVFFIDVDVALKQEAVLKNMVDFFGLPHMPVFNLDLRRNKTPFILFSSVDSCKIATNVFLVRVCDRIGGSPNG